MKNLGLNVKSLREKHNFTQDKMMDFGFNYRYFQKIEAGEVNATLDTLVKLAKALKCKISDLLN